MYYLHLHQLWNIGINSCNIEQRTMIYMKEKYSNYIIEYSIK